MESSSHAAGPLAAPAAPRYPAASSSTKGETTVVEPSRAEQAIARRSAEIRATVPDLDLSVTIDAAPAVRLALATHTSVMAVAIAAAARALGRHPRANGAYRDGHYELFSRVNVGVIASGPQAPVSVTLLDADRRSLDELHRELHRLRDRARAGELTSPEQSGATFTMSDLGPHGVAQGAPLVVAPQAAALAVGAVREAPVVIDGTLAVGQVLTLTLACDHRILFGEQAGAFLGAVAQELTSPARLEPERG